MLIKSTTNLGNGNVLVEVVDGSGFIQRHIIAEGGVTALMKGLRESN